MSKNPKDATTFESQIRGYKLANARLVAKNAAQAEELRFAKEALLKIKAGYDARVRTMHTMNIQQVLGITDQETLKLTQGASIEDLEQMFENYSLALDSQKTPYQKRKVATASIRPGAAATVPGGERMTVGNLFGKSAKEIKEMGGDF